MVEQDGVFVHVGSLRQFLHCLAAAVAAVVTPNDAEVANRHAGVLHQLDACLLEESFRAIDAREVVVVAIACHDGCVQTMKFLLHPFFIHGTNAAVDDVARHEDEVGMFGIQHVHPSRQFLAVVVITDVEVAGQYHLHFH